MKTISEKTHQKLLKMAIEKLENSVKMLNGNIEVNGETFMLEDAEKEIISQQIYSSILNFIEEQTKIDINIMSKILEARNENNKQKNQWDNPIS